MGAGPIFLEWSDVISRGYDWGFPQVNSFLAHISKYKHRAKNYKDVADSSQCEDLDGVKNMKISTFVCQPIREEVKSTSPLLVCRLGEAMSMQKLKRAILTITIFLALMPGMSE